MGQAERIIPLVVATGLAPSVLRELNSYELEVLTDILKQRG
jgi:hypothetical protein